MNSITQILSSANHGFELCSGDRTIGYMELVERVGVISKAMSHGETVAVCVRDPQLCLIALLATWVKEGRVLLVGERPAESTQEIINLEQPSLIIEESHDQILTCRRVNSPINNTECGLTVYTSGTLGRPKSVEFRDEAIVSNVQIAAQLFALNTKDIVFCPVIPTLTGVIMMVLLPCLVTGAHVILPTVSSPTNVLRKIESCEPSVVYCVPYWYELFVKSPIWNQFKWPSSVRLLLSSSAMLNKDVSWKFVESVGLHIRSVYCSSEIGIGTFNDATDFDVLTSSVGRPVPGVNLKILNADGEIQSAGIPGRVYITSPYCASKYNFQDELSKQTFTDFGVFTGDVGWLDSGGYLYLLGREAITFNIAGFLVYPQEVEELIGRFVDTNDVLVYATLHHESQSYLVAEIAGDFDEETLRKHCQMHLPGYKVPRVFRRVSEITRNESGKKVYPRAWEYSK